MDDKNKHTDHPGSVSVVEVNFAGPTTIRKRTNYAPFVSRTPFLLFICCIALACIGGLQVAVKRSIPVSQAAFPSRLNARRDEQKPAGPDATFTWGYAAQAMPRQDQGDSTTAPDTLTTSTTTPFDDLGDPLMGSTTTTTSSPRVSYAPTTGFVELGPGTEMTSTTAIEGLGPTSTTASNDLPPTETGHASTTAYVEYTSQSVMTSEQPTYSSLLPSAYIEITQVSVDSHGQVITSIATIKPTDASYITYMSSFTGSDGQVSTTFVVKPAQRTDGIIPGLISGAEVQIPVSKFGDRHYIFATYAGTFIAVILKILWACVYSGNKMMEPFYQLNRKTGATVKESLMADYLSSGISWWSLKIMFRGHWTMLLTVLVSLFIGLLPSFATEAMTVRTTSMCLFPDGSTRRCNPIWILNINMVRVVQTLLSLVAFCIIIIVFINFRRKSGISANPSSIATMATLLHHPDMLQEIRSIRMDASNEDIAARLVQNRYIIGTWQDLQGRERTGIMKAAVDFNRVHTGGNPYRVDYAPVNNPGETNERPLKREAVDKMIDALLVIFMVGILAITLAYWFDGSESGFNKFFSSDKFGPRFIMTSAASLIAMFWLDLEREVRILSPYRQLARRNADPKQTILATVDGYLYVNLFSSLRQRNWLHFLVSLAAILSDILIIAVGSVPFSSAQRRWSFIAGTWITVSILAYMAPVIISVLVWRRLNQKLTIPYQPNETLLRTWMGIANEGNQIRSMLNGWEDASKRDRDEHCLAQDATYWAGWIRDVDGRERWCVDREGSQALVGYHRP